MGSTRHINRGRHRLKEAQRAVQVRAVQGVAENQESQSSGSDTNIGWLFLSHEFIRNL
jgi:hypothetical protein